ncbi:alanine/ornithine racemase family PLP-dependent enzyme [Romboutsia weinsteinii]|uniref:Alanine/ornithine racemase family PLP-dependent enzyme n=1 Tax=Romboutsia weinsteinii TaxID=2020949 RepID=A0A371J650_9FIRM|nr:ornithine racemase Orr [Romboutsia weinsteinii]RDY28225.1 alanine/ornithine racemase family PLP-dependent enzyme [Romboutsia weinsteinii]
MCPKLEIDVKKLRENTRIVCKMCHDKNIDVAMVTKSYCAIESVVEALSKESIDYIADSRIDNLKNLNHIRLPKILLRIPMISEVDEVVKYSDISFNSELETIRRLNEVAIGQNKIHKIAVMVDLGDLREGFFNVEELLAAIDEVVKMENIKIIGLATNLTCYGAIIPSKENLQRLVDLAKSIEDDYRIKLDFISGGNSSSLYLLDKDEMPDGITNLRPGESIALGRETAYGNPIKGCYQDAFKLVCEIVELKDKPSQPIGEIGVDAFGNKPEYVDRGIRRRAILAIGKQDIDITSLEPMDKAIEILGASSDHMILDITDSSTNYLIGDKVEFLLGYGGLMSASTSKYVEKSIIYEKVSAAY